MRQPLFLLVGVRGGEILIIVHFGCWLVLRTTRDRPAGDPRKIRERVVAGERRRNLKNRTDLWLFAVGAAGQWGGSFLKHIYMRARVYLWKVPPRRPAVVIIDA